MSDTNKLIDKAIKAKGDLDKKPTPKDIDEYEQSAQYISVLFSQFKKFGYDLANRKKRSPIRVLEAFIFGGLHEVKLHGKDEKDLLALCQQVVYHKNNLVEYMLKRKKEQEQKELSNESDKE